MSGGGNTAGGNSSNVQEAGEEGSGLPAIRRTCYKVDGEDSYLVG